MRLLFFDIECANHYNGKGKICEVGYIITDEKFNILARKDIPINPQSRFNLIGRKKERDLHLAHEANNYQKYKEAKTYYEHYDNLKYLFTQQDILIFGFSCLEDKKDILNCNARYKLDDFKFDCYDIQKIYQKFIGAEKRYGLEKICKELNLPITNLIHHKPDDDSLMSMLILRHICENKNTSITDLVNDYNTCLIKHESMTIKEVKNIGQKLWLNFCENNKDNLVNNKDIVTISSLLKKDAEEIKKLIEIIKNKKWIPSNSTNDSTILIVKDEDDDIRLKSALKKEFTGKVILEKDLI